MFILNPDSELKRKWYWSGYLEGKFIVRKFGLSPIWIDDKFYYFVENEEFQGAIPYIPMWMKLLSYIKRNWRLNKIQRRIENFLSRKGGEYWRR